MDIAFASRVGRVVLLVLSVVTLSPAAIGHSAGESYLWFNIDHTHIEGRFEISTWDLNKSLGLDLPDDYEAAREAVRATASQVQAYLRTQFAIIAEGREIPIEFTGTGLLEAQGTQLGHFAQYAYRTARFEIPDRVKIRNAVLLDGTLGWLHRSLLVCDYNRKTGTVYNDENSAEGKEAKTHIARVFGPASTEQTLDLTHLGGLIPNRQFVWQGMLHIWIGIDHILFLVVLLLTAVTTFDRETRTWHPVPTFGRAFWNIVKIVTLFTLAHSITLSMAALGLLIVPSRLIETVIALSIVVVALNNLFPVFRERSWIVILLFGLFHGLGFATVMAELPFRMPNLTKVILYFNAGVEIGQAAIVAAIFPLLFALRRTALYQKLVLSGGSAAIAALATWWCIERALGL